MQRQPSSNRSAARQQDRYIDVGSKQRHLSLLLGRGNSHIHPKKPSTNLSTRARSLQSPETVSEDAIKKLHLSNSTKSRTTGKLVSATRSIALLLAVGLIPIIAALVWHSGRFATAEVNKSNTNLSEIVNTDGLAPTLGTPSEKTPAKDKGGYTSVKVAFDQPNRLLIDKLGVSAQIRNLGANDNGLLMFPGNIYDIGWYNKSALPGNKNTILLDGYTEGPTKKGLLYSGDQLKTGDTITIVRGDGVHFDYRVNGNQLYYNQTQDINDILKNHNGTKQLLALAVSQSSSTNKGGNSRQSLIIFAQLY